MDRRPRDPGPDRRRHRSWRRYPCRTRPADVTRKAGREGRRPRPCPARQSRGHEPHRAHARRVSRDLCQLRRRGGDAPGVRPRWAVRALAPESTDHCVVDDTIFMHAGISPAESSQSISDLNNRVRRDIELWDAGVRVLQKRKLVPQSPEFMQVVDAARAEIERLNATVPTGKIPPDAREVAAALLPVANIGESSLSPPRAHSGSAATRHGPTRRVRRRWRRCSSAIARAGSSRATARSAMAASASGSAARYS